MSGFVRSVRTAVKSKLRSTRFKSWPGRVSGQVTIIMWGT